MQSTLAPDPVAARPPVRRRDAFTLLEMLVVMGIMLAIATVVVGSYMANVRGASWRSAAAHFEQAMTLARQRACMDGQTTLLLVLPPRTNTTERMEYVICRQAGEVTGETEPYAIKDEFADLTAFNNASRRSQGTFEGVIGAFFNIRSGKQFHINNILNDTTIIITNMPPNEKVAPAGGDWVVGDRYGWALHPKQQLPTGFYFFNAPSDETKIWGVTFAPDGHSSDISGSGTSKFQIREWMGEARLEAVVTITHPSSHIVVTVPNL